MGRARTQSEKVARDSLSLPCRPERVSRVQSGREHLSLPYVRGAREPDHSHDATAERDRTGSGRMARQARASLQSSRCGWRKEWRTTGHPARQIGRKMVLIGASAHLTSIGAHLSTGRSNATNVQSLRVAMRVPTISRSSQESGVHGTGMTESPSTRSAC